MTNQKPNIAAVRAATALRTIVSELRQVTAAQDQAPTRARLQFLKEQNNG